MIRLRRTHVSFPALLLAASFAARGDGAGLRELVQEYNGAKPKVRAGNPDQKREKTKSELRPILMKIAKLDTPEALGFLKKEFETESPEIATACVVPILACSSEKAPGILLLNFLKRPRTLKQEILLELGKTKRDISSLEGALAGLLQAEDQLEVRKEFPALLGRIDTVGAAKALLNSLQGPGANRGDGKAAEGSDEHERRVMAALRQTKSPAVKEWLAGEAFSGAPPARLIALERLAGDLKLEAARERLEKHLESSDEAVAAEALAALTKIGPVPSAAKIVEGLRKGKRSLSFKIQALDALAAAGTEETIAVVLQAAKDTDPATRAIALGSLARVPGLNEAALEAILAGVGDGEGEVRGAAIRALRGLRHKKMVPVLIEAMAAEKEEKPKIDILKLLIELTGKNMGFVVEDWKKWWEVTEPTFEFAKDVKPGKIATAGKAQDLRYFGIEIASKRLSFLVDFSSSMTETVEVYIEPEKKSEEKEESQGTTQARPAEEDKGDGKEAKDGERQEKKKREGKTTKARKIDVLKRELVRVIGNLPKDAQINIVSFDAKFKPWQDNLQPLAGPGRQKAVDFVRGLNTGVGTNVFDTLEFALRDRRVDTVFLLTDGLPTKGRIIDPASILREVRALNRIRGVTINCIAFGEESALLKDLAKENGGVYRFVDTIDS